MGRCDWENWAYCKGKGADGPSLGSNANEPPPIKKRPMKEASKAAREGRLEIRGSLEKYFECIN
jgi:hypothetical protein